MKGYRNPNGFMMNTKPTLPEPITESNYPVHRSYVEWAKDMIKLADTLIADSEAKGLKWTATYQREMRDKYIQASKLRYR